MKSRETFFGGDIRLQKNFEDRQRSNTERAMLDVEQNPEFENILNEIDFKILREILLENLTRSGITAEDANILGREDIHCQRGIESDRNSSFKQLASYNSLINKIFVRYDYLKEKFGKPSLEFVLHLVIHEMVHACSRFIYDHSSRGDHSEGSGYRQMNKVRGGYRIFGSDYKAFDEAVTEKIAQELMQEYARRNGNTAQFHESEVLSAKKKMVPYRGLVEHIDKIIDKISQSVDMPREVVWEAIKKGKFGKNELEDPAVRKELEDIFGVGFLDRLSKSNFEDVVGSLGRIPYKIKYKLIQWLSNMKEAGDRLGE